MPRNVRQFVLFDVWWVDDTIIGKEQGALVTSRRTVTRWMCLEFCLVDRWNTISLTVKVWTTDMMEKYKKKNALIRCVWLLAWKCCVLVFFERVFRFSEWIHSSMTLLLRVSVIPVFTVSYTCVPHQSRAARSTSDSFSLPKSDNLFPPPYVYFTTLNNNEPRAKHSVSPSNTIQKWSSRRTTQLATTP